MASRSSFITVDDFSKKIIKQFFLCLKVKNYQIEKNKYKVNFVFIERKLSFVNIFEDREIFSHIFSIK